MSSVKGAVPIKDTQLYMHRVRCKIAVSINIAIYSLGKVDKQYSEASNTNSTVHCGLLVNNRANYPTTTQGPWQRGASKDSITALGLQGQRERERETQIL